MDYGENILVYQDTGEGRKVCTYYHLVSVPAILLIDPITGQKMRGWSGMVYPDSLLEVFSQPCLSSHVALQW